MTAAQVLLANRGAPPPASARASAGEADAAQAEASFDEALDQATGEQGQGAEVRGSSEGRRGNRVSAFSQSGRASGSEELLKDDVLSAEQQPQPTAANVMLQVASAIVGVVPVQVAVQTSSSASPEESPEALLARLLASTNDRAGDVAARDAEAPEAVAMPSELLPSDDDAEISFRLDAPLADVDAEKLSADISNTKVAVRGQETHLALAKPIVITGDAEVESGGDVDAARMADSDLQAPDAKDVQPARRETGSAGSVPPPVEPPVLRRATTAPQQSRQERPSLPDAVAGSEAGDAAVVQDLGEAGAHGTASGQSGQQGAGGNSLGREAVLPGGVPMQLGRAGEVRTFDGLIETPSVASQIADRVAADVRSGEATTGSTDGAVRVLQLELKPVNLGSVTVRLSLKDDVVSLHLEAQRPETVAAIARERDELAAALKQAGYVVDQITTQQVDLRSSGRVEGAQQGSFGSFSPSQGQGSVFDQGRGGGSGSDGNQRQARPGEGGDRDGVSQSSRSGLSRERSGELYV